nr:DUF4142 domain-containing protein [Sphingomonas xinjiangensis]
MPMRKTIVTSVALLALAACGRGNDAGQTNTITTSEADGATVASTASVAAPSGAQTFANVAAASDAFEIETSRLALANGSSEAVKSFANKMIEAHTASTAKLKTATGSSTPAITPDPMLNAEQQQKLAELKALNGSALDQAYKAEQAAGHQKTLDALKAYSANGEDAQLKAFAAGMIPIVTAHLNMAKSLKA